MGDRDRQIEIRRELYRRAPGIHSYRALEAILPTDERGAFGARACQDAKTGPHVATEAELLFALEEPALAEQLIIERSAELDGRRNYVLLTALVKTAKATGRILAAALIVVTSHTDPTSARYGWPTGKASFWGRLSSAS